MNMLSKAAAAVTLASALVASAAQAETAEMRVRIGDLNVHSDAGATAALRRIKNAAASFCGNYDRDLSYEMQVLQCRRDMTDKAVAKLAAPRVTALYRPSQSVLLAEGGANR